MYMGDKKLSRKALALRSGVTRTSLGDKLDGRVEFTIADIIKIADAIGESWLWVMTGAESPHPDGGGGQPAPVAPVQVNIPASGLWITRPAAA